jgi:hypothetical protein
MSLVEHLHPIGACTSGQQKNDGSVAGPNYSGGGHQVAEGLLPLAHTGKEPGEARGGMI